MESKYKKYVVATSFIIAAAIFASGILLGIFFDRYRIDDILESTRAGEQNTESYLAEQLFIENMGQGSCEILKPRLIDMSNDLVEIGRKLTLYESGTLPLKKSDYDYMKRRYFVLEARTYVYELKMKQTCSDNRTLILFFYKGNNDESLRQGYALDEIYKIYRDDVSTRVFDIDFQNSTITDLLEKYYNITSAPTIVINGNITKTGFVSVGELNAMIREKKM